MLIGFKLKLIVGAVVNKFILENSKLNGMVYDVFIILALELYNIISLVLLKYKPPVADGKVIL